MISAKQIGQDAELLLETQGPDLRNLLERAESKFSLPTCFNIAYQLVSEQNSFDSIRPVMTDLNI